jgi:hypothetical protein
MTSPRLSTSTSAVSSPLLTRAVPSATTFSMLSPRTPRAEEGSPRDLSSLTTAERMARKVDHLTNELLQSERSYLKDVELLIQIYLEPMRRTPKSPRGEDDGVSDLLTPVEVNGVSC